MDAVVCYSDPSSWIEAIIPSASGNIGSRWLSDGSFFRYCPQLKRVTLSKLIGSLQLMTSPCPSMNASPLWAKAGQNSPKDWRADLCGDHSAILLCSPTSCTPLLVLNPWELSRKLPAFEYLPQSQFLGDSVCNSSFFCFVLFCFNRKD